MTTRPRQLESWTAKLARAFLGKKPVPHADAKRQPVGNVGLAGAARTVMNVIADDCNSFVNAAARQTQRVFDEAFHRTTTRSVWLPSFMALGSADVALASHTLTRSTIGLEAVGAAGGAGLMAVSTFNLWRARTAEERLDAAADLAWGVQGFSYVTGAARVASLTTGMGFVGAASRMTVGALRIKRGLRMGDKQSVKLGTLDVGAGILWAALDVAGLGHPLVLGSYVAVMVGREAYAHRDALRRAIVVFRERLFCPVRPRELPARCFGNAERWSRRPLVELGPT